MAEDFIQIKIDEASLKEAQHILRGIPRAFPRVMSRAINRAVDMAATDLKRRVADQIELPKGEVAKGIGKRKASLANLAGAVDALPHRPALMKFKGTRQIKRGVKYRIGTAGFKTILHGFIATMKSGHRGVFLRATYAKGKFISMVGKPKREAIYERFGPSIWKVITNTPGLLTEANQKAAENLNKQVNDYISLKLRNWSR